MIIKKLPSEYSNVELYDEYVRLKAAKAYDKFFDYHHEMDEEHFKNVEKEFLGRLKKDQFMEAFKTFVLSFAPKKN